MTPNDNKLLGPMALRQPIPGNDINKGLEVAAMWPLRREMNMIGRGICRRIPC